MCPLMSNKFIAESAVCRMTRLCFLISGFTLLAFTPVSFAVQIFGDNFDSGSLSPSWDSIAGTTVVTGGANSTTHSASLAATTGALGETLVSSTSPAGMANFIIDGYIRLLSSSNRQFSLQVSTTSTTPNVNAATINLRYQAGAFAVFNNSSWVTLTALGTVNPGDWHRIQVEGSGWGAAGASYTIRVSDANGTTFTRTASGLTTTHNGTITGARAQSFVFNTAFGSNPGFSADNIVVEGIGLAVAPSSPAADFAFPSAPLVASPLTRTVKYRNNGISSLDIQSVAITDSGTGVFSLGAVIPASPVTLAPGQTIDIPVLATSSSAGSFAGTLVIDTNSNFDDRTVPLTATFLPGANLVWKGTVDDNWDIGGNTNWNNGTADAAYNNGDFAVFDDTAAGSGSVTVNIPADVAPGGVSFLNTSARDYTIQSPGAIGITGTTSVSKTGNGLLALLSDNPYTGGTTISDGTLSFGLNGLGTVGSIAMRGGTLRWHGTNTQDVSSRLAMVAGQTATFDTNSNNVVFASAVGSSASASLTKQGGGILTLSGANTYTGATTVNAGTLRLTRSNGLNTSSGAQVNAGGTLEFATGMTGQDSSVAITLNGGKLLNNAWNFYYRAITLNAGDQNLEILGNALNSWTGSSITGPGNLVKTGGSNLTAWGGNAWNYTGTTTVNNGNIQIESSHPGITATPAVTLNTGARLVSRGTEKLNNAAIVTTAGGTLQLSGTVTETIGGITGTTGSVENPTAATVANLIVENTSPAASTFGGVIQNGLGTIAFTKNGTGDQTLTGINTYTGNTTVNGGNLILADNARLTFRPGDASTNSISGAGTVVLDGDFAIDTSALTVTTGTWLLENVTTLTGPYGTTFQVVNPDGSTWTDAGNNKWTKPSGANVYTFDETTGTLTLGPANTFASWMSSFDFSAYPGASTIPNGDADGDGISNLIENILGTPPNAPSSGLTQISGSNSTVTFHHPLNATPAANVTHSYEWSTDLIEWKSSGQTNTSGTSATITAGAPVSGVVSVTAVVTSGPASKLFVRLIAIQAP